MDIVSLHSFLVYHLYLSTIFLSLTSVDVTLKVHLKSCPDLDTVGPTWYRLEPIHPTKGLGVFQMDEETKEYWSFEAKDDVSWHSS